MTLRKQIEFPFCSPLESPRGRTAEAVEFRSKLEAIQARVLGFEDPPEREQS